MFANGGVIREPIFSAEALDSEKLIIPPPCQGSRANVVVVVAIGV